MSKLLSVLGRYDLEGPSRKSFAESLNGSNMHHANVTDEAMNPKTLAAVSFIEKNLHRKIGVVEICQSVRLSRSRLSWLFTNEMGMPPRQYLRKLRMQKGREFSKVRF